MKISFGSKLLDLSSPHVMGILNVTPDSFYDGGSHMDQVGLNLDSALNMAERMCNAGASFIDVGGESTRPGALKVSLQQELDRVIPVVEAISACLNVVVSVDTSTPEVMVESKKAGAGLLNDVRALTREGAVEAASSTGLPVCLMHMKGDPQTMQNNPQYSHVVKEVCHYLSQRKAACIEAGVKQEKILVDPGFGFGKTDEHNLTLLKQLSYIKALSSPVLVGLSRKSMIGRLLNREVDERLPASLALALLSLQNGASILRVHDVQETMDVVKIYNELEKVKNV